MKKSNFTALVLGTVSGILFALGMCMALLPQWNAFLPGVICGAAGVVLGLITLFIWRKMEHKPPIKISGKGVIAAVIGVAGALMLGLGMVFSMVWGNMPLGIAIGVLGIVALLFLIPIINGLRD